MQSVASAARGAGILEHRQKGRQELAHRIAPRRYLRQAGQGQTHAREGLGKGRQIGEIVGNQQTGFLRRGDAAVLQQSLRKRCGKVGLFPGFAQAQKPQAVVGSGRRCLSPEVALHMAQRALAATPGLPGAPGRAASLGPKAMMTVQNICKGGLSRVREGVGAGINQWQRL